MSESSIKYEDFLKYKIQGYSQREISEKLGISQQTLSKWNGKLGEEIKERRGEYLNTLVDYYLQYQFNQFTILHQLKTRALATLLSRDYHNTSTRELLSIVEHVNMQIDKLTKDAARESNFLEHDIFSNRESLNINFDMVDYQSSMEQI